VAYTFLYLPSKRPFYISILPSFFHSFLSSFLPSFLPLFYMIPVFEKLFYLLSFSVCLFFYSFFLGLRILIEVALKHSTLLTYDYVIERRSIII